MNTPPTTWCDSTLVVIDGPQRLTWRKTAPADWAPVALWPDEQQAARLREHMSSGGSVLVLVEREQTSVTMFATEASAAPAELLPRITVDGELAELRIDALDWLPQHLQERGRRFLHETAALIEDRPGLLLPHLLVEQPGSSDCAVRFGRIRRPQPVTTDRLCAATGHLFGPQRQHYAMETAS